jgi:hypothetical protein
MKTSVKRGAQSAFNLLILAAFFYLLFNPDLVSASVTRSIYLCVRVIVPSLFIFMVLSRLIIAMPFTTAFFSRRGRYGIEAMVLTLGLLCGFPVGAKSAVFLYESGAVSKKRAEFICAFTNGASASFLIGYIGGSLYADITVGVRLFLFQVISALTTAVVLRILFMKKEDFTFIPIPEQERRGGMTEAVVDSTFTMISVCAFIITFSLLGELFLNIVKAERISSVLIKGIFEFSSGIASAAGVGADPAFIMICLFAGFSGLCVIMQVMSVMSGKLSPGMYFTGRLINTAVFGLLSLLFGIS